MSYVEFECLETWKPQRGLLWHFWFKYSMLLLMRWNAQNQKNQSWMGLELLFLLQHELSLSRKFECSSIENNNILDNLLLRMELYAYNLEALWGSPF